jgi:hypothetical protein
MTMLKTIDGQEIDSEKFKGFGTFKKYVQENIDSEYGKENSSKSTTFEVEFSATRTVNVYTTIEVEATTKKEAEKKAMQEINRISAWDWSEGCHEDIDNIEIESVTLIKDDE